MENRSWSMVHGLSSDRVEEQLMQPFEIVDTFPAFEAYWAKVQSEPVEAQIECWAQEYMSGWPGLLDKQIEDYAGQSLDWQAVARERVFPELKHRLPAMRRARRNLLKLCPVVCSKAERVLGFGTNPYLVIY